MVEQNSPMKGLPAGWIVNVRVRKTGRKDKYYIDPVGGYVFRSMTDVSCYLENGKLGRRVRKLKDKSCINIEFGDDKLSSSAEAEDQKLEDSGTISRKNEDILQSNCTLNDIDHRQGKDDTSKSSFIPASVVGMLPEKRPSENRAEKPENKKIQREMHKLDDKKGHDSPRRASKRLAGVEVPLLELKTTNRVRQVVARQPGEAKVDAPADSGNLGTAEKHAVKVETKNVTDDEKQELKTTNRVRQVVARQSSEAKADATADFGKLGTAEKHSVKVETKNVRDDEKQELPYVSPPETLSHAGEVETDKKDDEKPGSPLDLSLKDSWMNIDPCIEFAIKTLTGAIPIEDEKNVNPGSSCHLPFGDSSTDPCIEFAVKTLMGDIPVGDDLCTRAYFHQQSSLSTAQPCNGLTMPRASLDNLFQANLSSQHPDNAERPPRPTIF